MSTNLKEFYSKSTLIIPYSLERYITTGLDQFKKIEYCADNQVMCLDIDGKSRIKLFAFDENYDPQIHPKFQLDKVAQVILTISIDTGASND